MTPSPLQVLLISTYAVAIAVALYLGGAKRWRDALEDRFWYGVPWGTLVTIAFVLAIYLFVQGGLRNWHNPVVLPFRAWSYLYPTGLLTAGFAHSGSGHLVGNLLGTVALAPIAEFAWGHYPGGRRSGDGPVEAPSRSRPPEQLRDSVGVRDRLRASVRVPWVRAFVVFPGAVLLVGLLTALFAVGPVIGFSGVVFAFGGFALVRYPVTTLAALLVSSSLSTTYYAYQSPIVRSGISGSAPSPPGWATIAIQGHALGILLGVVLGLALLQYRNVRPNVGRVLLAMVIYGMSRRLWAIYWFEGNGTYVMYRGLGVSLVVALGVTVAIAASASGRPVPEAVADLPGSPTVDQLSWAWLGLLAVLVAASAPLAVVYGWPVAPAIFVAGVLAMTLALPAIWALSPIELDELPTGRQTAFAVLIVVLIFVAIPAMLPNLVTVEDDPVPNEEAITVEGYSVTYAEDVRNQMIPAIDLPFVANRTSVATSGVIVVNEDRQLWTTERSEQYVESEGGASVTLGGVGWRETVYVDRTGWSVTGNDTAYAVDLQHDGERVRAFRSPGSHAAPVVANHTVEVVPADDRFELHVARDNRSVGTAPVPAVGNATNVGQLTLQTVLRDDRVTIVASADGTHVPVAKRETYRQK